MLKTLIIFILMLGVLISIHELGHLIAAKWAGVYCYEYSIGMGPLVYQRKGKETAFSIRALPIGGYVAMAGEQQDQDDQYNIEVPAGRRLNEVPYYKRIIVMLAGVTMNAILAFVLMYSAVFLNGGYTDSSVRPATVMGIIEEGAASQAGLQVNDEIVGLILQDGTQIDVDNFEQVSPYIDGQQLTLIIDRDGQSLQFTLTPTYDSESDRYLIGIQTASGTWVDANFLTAFKGSWIMIKEISVQIVEALVGMFTGDGLKNVSGVVGAYQMTDQVIQMGLLMFLIYVSMFSLNLAIFNLLPLPALDGGRVVLLIVEMIIGHPLNKKFENGLIIVSFALLMLLTVVITCKDIVNLFM